MKDNFFSEPQGFMSLFAKRQEAQARASADPITEKAVNTLAKRLHPASQTAFVTEITEHYEGCKSYILKVDGEATYFAAGQYLNVFVRIDGNCYQRPYSISSSPKQSLEGIYRITVKAAQNGLVSNYIINNWQIGTKVKLSAPEGNFCYEPLRDEEHIIAVAGGSGITPLVSLAHSIADGDEDCRMTLLYCVRDENDILFRDELDTLGIEIEYIVGNITAEKILQYAKGNPYSLFVCGPAAMYEHIAKENEKLMLRSKHIRYEGHEPCYIDDMGTEYPLTVISKGVAHSLVCHSNRTLLYTLEKAGLTPPSSCRSGECGLCRSRLISGEVYIPEGYEHRRQADLKYGYIHPCCSYPKGEIKIEIYPDC